MTGGSPEPLGPLDALLKALDGAVPQSGSIRYEPGPPVRDPETGHTWIPIGEDGSWLMIPAGVTLP